jgi:hypothetical protein
MNFSIAIGMSIINNIIPTQKKKNTNPTETAIPIIIDMRQPIEITPASF